MAPVKPMAADDRSRRDSNPKTRPGVTGFEQEYNQEEPPRQDLNPDAVSDASVLPPAQAGRAAKAPKAQRSVGRKRKG